MMKRIIVDPNTKMVIVGEFDKFFKNKNYELFFNTKTGVEVLNPLEGKKDPFMTELPTMCDVGIMGHCKNNCNFCYQGSKVEPNMKIEDFKRIIDQVKHHASQVALGGRGNPEDHEDFEEIVKYARENGVVPNYTTAGNNVNSKIVGITKEYVGAVAVSMYDKTFTYTALNMFMTAGCKTNIHQIYSAKTHTDVMKLFRGENEVYNKFVDLETLNAIVLLLFKMKGNGKNLVTWVPNEFQIKELAKEINKTKLSFKIGMDSCLINKIQPYAELTPQQEMSIDTCESSRMSVYITPDMKLVPCSFADHDTHSISLKNTTIADAWLNGEGFGRFRRILSETPNCCPALME